MPTSASPPTASRAARLDPRSLLTVPLPKKPACILRGSPPEGYLSFSLADGAPLGTVDLPTPITAHIGTDVNAVVLEAELPAISVRGVTSTVFLPTFLSRPAFFSEVVLPLPTQQVLVAAADSRIRLTIHTGPFIRFLNGDREASTSLPCDAVSLDAGSFDPFAGFLGETIDQGDLLGPSILVSTKKDGPAVAELSGSAADPIEVSVLAVEGRRMHIVHRDLAWLVVGWVDAKHFQRNLRQAEPFEAPPRPNEADGTPRRILVCPHPLPVHGRAGDKEGVFAIVHAGAVVPITAERKTALDVDLRDLGVSKDAFATFTVDKRDTVGCREQGP